MVWLYIFYTNASRIRLYLSAFVYYVSFIWQDNKPLYAFDYLFLIKLVLIVSYT